jgi:predicted transcriptional regulator
MHEKRAEVKAETRVLTAHVPQKLAEQVDAYAARMERSRGWIVKQALADWVALEEERYRLTMEAMADADAGRFIEDEDMATWIESLDSDHPLPPPTPR